MGDISGDSDDKLDSAVHTQKPCSLCDKSFITKYLLDQHVRAVHEKKRLTCDFCSETFAYRSGRTRHVQSQHDKWRFVCTACGSTYTSRESAYSHIKSKHAGDSSSHGTASQCLVKMVVGKPDESAASNDSSPVKKPSGPEEKEAVVEEEAPDFNESCATASLNNTEAPQFLLALSNLYKQCLLSGNLNGVYNPLAPLLNAAMALQHPQSINIPDSSSIDMNTSLFASLLTPPQTVNDNLFVQQQNNGNPTDLSVSGNCVDLTTNLISEKENAESTPNTGISRKSSGPKSVNKQRWKCCLCDKTFAYNAGRSKHVRSVHQRVRYRCLVCNCTYTTKDYASQHISSAHSIKTNVGQFLRQIFDRATTPVSRHDGDSVLAYKSAAAKKIYPSEANADRNLQSSVDNDVPEENDCKETIDANMVDVSDEKISLADLASPSMAQQQQYLPFHCLQCGVGFSDQGQLFYHASLQHNSSSRNGQQIEIAKTDPIASLLGDTSGPWRCHLCDFTALRSVAMFGHLETEHGAKMAIQCTMCNEKFAQAAKAAYHVELEHSCDPVQFLVWRDVD